MKMNLVVHLMHAFLVSVYQDVSGDRQRCSIFGLDHVRYPAAWHQPSLELFMRCIIDFSVSIVE